MSATGITITITEGVCSTYDHVPAVAYPDPDVIARAIAGAEASVMDWFARLSDPLPPSRTLTLDDVLAVRGQMHEAPLLMTPDDYREWRAKLAEHERLTKGERE